MAEPFLCPYAFATRMLWMSACILLNPIRYDAMLSPLLMWNKIGRIVSLIQKDLDISPEEALDMFYRSRTNQLMRDPSTMLYTLGDRYLADEVMRDK